MATPAGFALILRQKRREAFFHEIGLVGDRFAEPVLEFAHSRKAPLVCFISAANGAITHLARGRRGIRAGTGLRRLNLADVTELRPAVRANAVVNRIPARLRRWVSARLKRGGPLSDKGFHALVEAVREIAPTSRALLNQFSQDRQNIVDRLPQPLRQALGYQKEAIATALNIAGLGRDALQQWTPGTVALPVSFLEGLPVARLREDPMVINDLTNVPGFDLLRTMPYTAAVFEGNDGTHLTVLLANRQPLEQQLGTDLIYYNANFESFIMVQYKAMEHNVAGAGFRVPNKQLATEIGRMGEVLSEIRKCAPDDSMKSFRLHDNPFFLKLCPRIVFGPNDTGLVPGMYLPLDYWKLLETAADITGPRQGRRVTYENVGRYFNNSEFVSLVAKAWVGTTVTQSAVLATAIRATLEAGKAVAIAVKKTGPLAASAAISDLKLPIVDRFDE